MGSEVVWLCRMHAGEVDLEGWRLKEIESFFDCCYLYSSIVF
jgi:hypothetical protein